MALLENGWKSTGEAATRVTQIRGSVSRQVNMEGE